MAWQPLSKILKFVSQGLEKSVEMENLVLPLKDVSDQVRPFLNQELKERIQIFVRACRNVNTFWHCRNFNDVKELTLNGDSSIRGRIQRESWCMGPQSQLKHIKHGQ